MTTPASKPRIRRLVNALVRGKHRRWVCYGRHFVTGLPVIASGATPKDAYEAWLRNAEPQPSPTTAFGDFIAKQKSRPWWSWPLSGMGK